MEPLMGTAAEATDMLRMGRSAVYRLDRSEAAGVDQDRPPAARIGRLDPQRRGPECGVVYVVPGGDTPPVPRHASAPPGAHLTRKETS
jgi:hypothetical protein